MAGAVAQAGIEIQASIQVVWAILVDFEAYPEWNPFIVEVTNITPRNQPVAVDSHFWLRCEYSDFVTTTSRERVTQITPPTKLSGGAEGVRRAVLAYRLAGVLSSLRIVQGTRFQWLEQGVGGDVTGYRTEETFTGLGAALVPLAQVQDGFARMAAALKTRAESRTKGPVQTKPGSD